MTCFKPYYDNKTGTFVARGTEYKEGMLKEHFKESNTEKAEALKAEVNKTVKPVQGESGSDPAQEEAAKKLYKEFYTKAKELLPDETPQGLSRAVKAYMESNPESTVEEFVAQYKKAE